jgi:hypothetical protein
MDLKFPFPLEVRTLFMDCWQCWECGGNGSNCGGLELHHIYGRISDSAFNASVLCKDCHNRVGHTQEEHVKFVRKTISFLYANKEYTGFTWSPREDQFMVKIRADLELLELSTIWSK